MWVREWTHLEVSPRGRVNSFLHRGLHLVHQNLGHTSRSQEQQLTGLEALLDVAGRLGDPEPEQRIELCSRRRSSVIKYHLSTS